MRTLKDLAKALSDVEPGGLVPVSVGELAMLIAHTDINRMPGYWKPTPENPGWSDNEPAVDPLPLMRLDIALLARLVESLIRGTQVYGPEMAELRHAFERNRGVRQ